MRDLVITLTEDAESLVSTSDVRNMLKALNAKPYVDEVVVDIDRLCLLLDKARKAEAECNRIVEQWERVAMRLKLD